MSPKTLKKCIDERLKIEREKALEIEMKQLKREQQFERERKEKEDAMQKRIEQLEIIRGAHLLEYQCLVAPQVFKGVMILCSGGAMFHMTMTLYTQDMNCVR